MSANSTVFSEVERLDSQALTARVDHLAARERSLVADFLVHLAELERRELHLELGYSSLFSYCTQHLRLSKAAAYRRTTAAGLIRRFPEIISYLRSGHLCLTTLCELRTVLESDNCAEVLRQAAGKSEDEVKVLVATLKPQPAQPDLLRKRPIRAAKLANTVGVRPTADPQPDAEPKREGADLAGPSTATGTGPELIGDRDAGLAGGTGPEPRAPAEPKAPAECFAPSPAPTVNPIGPSEYTLRMTVSEAFRQELEAVKQELSHKIPNGNLEDVLRECFRITLEVYAKRRRGSNRPRKARAQHNDATEAEPATRHVPIAIARQVWERDGGACAFIGTSGKRCGSRHQVQLHHVEPFARRQAHTVEGIELRCSHHNQYEARKDFGARHMARFRRRPFTLC